MSISNRINWANIQSALFSQRNDKLMALIDAKMTLNGAQSIKKPTKIATSELNNHSDTLESLIFKEIPFDLHANSENVSIHFQ